MIASESDLIQQAHDVGVGREWCLWAVAPEILGSRILDAAKRAARFIGKVSPGISHSACLEAVAHGARMPNWHTLQSLSQALVDDFDPDRHWPRPNGARDRAAALAATFPMLARTGAGCPPTAQEENGMRVFAVHLASAGSLSSADALNVIARMNGSDTWGELIQRRPQDSSEPLYGFRDEAPDHGRFVWSDACGDLVEEQDEMYQDYSGRSAQERSRCRTWIDQITAQRPDFLEGLLAKADILSYSAASPRTSGRVYADAISKAEALIPAGYRGGVSWLYVENRFYHRLLYGYMEWNIFHGSKTRAVDLASKQLRLNPGDNLGLRYILPLLLLAAGRPSAASKSLAALQDDYATDASAPFVRSLVFYAAGQRQEALKELLHALFVFPAIRNVLAFKGPGPFPRADPRTERMVIPDIGAINLQLAVVSRCTPSAESAFTSWIGDSMVIQAEKELEILFATSTAMEVWLQAVVDRASALAQLLEPPLSKTGRETVS